VPSLAQASLTEIERRVVRRLIELLRAELGDDLLAVWLFGSRARGERPGSESDVDLLVLTRGGRERHLPAAIRLLSRAADAEGASPAYFEVHVADPDWVQQRREIDSFFIREVDRDKVVLLGGP
jgi:predicted nucleotidyltransferase